MLRYPPSRSPLRRAKEGRPFGAAKRGVNSESAARHSHNRREKHALVATQMRIF
jgi:hypothetical protein